MLIKREDKNPILKPNKRHSWEARAVFNGSPVKKDGKTYLAYRALSLPHYHTLAREKLEVSEIGIAESDNGVDFTNRNRFIIPDKNWDRFGCEDPRVTEFEGRYYIFYTALSTYPFRPEGIRVGVAISDDLKCVREKHLVTPFNAKAMTLFPERVDGKLWAALSVNTDLPPSRICIRSFDEIEDIWNQSKWENWYKNFDQHALPLARKPEDQVEVGAQPIKTDEGWLLLYSYIRGYKTNDPLFGVEAVLLDPKDPSRVVNRTEMPILTPEEYYEEFGMVKNIVFPSGALSEDGQIKLYYGAADTTCCLTYIDEDALIKKMTGQKELSKLERSDKNPIIEPRKENDWESKATFNPAAVEVDGDVHILYRAMGQDNTSVIGYARSSDGVSIDYRADEPVYEPRKDFERKLVPGGNSGCEDPRVTKMDDTLYMLYTAFDGKNPPRVAMTSISVDDFLNENWKWSEPILISPPNFDDKDACLFSEKVDGQYFFIHRGGDDIDSSLNDSLADFDGETWLEEYRWIFPRPGMWDDEKVGVADAPIKTEKGWVMFYHGVSKEDKTYRIGAILLDKDDPKEVIARLDEPLFEPKTKYEIKGIVDNVTFPCGTVLMDGKFFVYYGGADKVTGVATIDKDELLGALEINRY